jgi:hypothetical protein
MLAQDIESIRFYVGDEELEPSNIFEKMYSGLGGLVNYNRGLSNHNARLGSKTIVDDPEDYTERRKLEVSKWVPPKIDAKIKTLEGQQRRGYLEPRRDIYLKLEFAEKTPSIIRLIIEDNFGKDMSPMAIRQSRGRYSQYEAERMPYSCMPNKPSNFMPVPESSYITTLEGIIGTKIRDISDIKTSEKIPRITPKMIPLSVNDEGEIVSIRNWYPSIDSQGYDLGDLSLMLGTEWGLGFANPDRAYYELCSVPRGRPIFDIDPDYRLLGSGVLSIYSKWKNFIITSEYLRTMDSLNGIEERRKKTLVKIPDKELCGLRLCEERRKELKKGALSVMDAVSEVFPQKDLEKDISRKVDENLVRDVYKGRCLF